MFKAPAQWADVFKAVRGKIYCLPRNIMKDIALWNKALKRLRLGQALECSNRHPLKETCPILQMPFGPTTKMGYYYSL